ncbi:hypothetical protein PHMEG_00034854, partial [Phytophthora megakarya]
MLLRAMGCESQRVTSDAAFDAWTPGEAGTALRKWKKKLRAAFGVEEIAPDRQVVAPQAFMPADPSQVPLPQTPVKQNESSRGVFGSKGSPYKHDSHMVSPTTASRQDRVVKEIEPSDLLDVDHLEGDLTEEWARQIRELSAKEEKNPTPRIEITTHLPLDNIKSFSGYRNKSKRSMQWLHGALHWYRQLQHKTRRTWKLLSDAFTKYYCSKFNQFAKERYYSALREDKEHVCDYLNRINGYARNAGVQFENGGRQAKDHVEHFLDTCNDRGLEERLCHVRVKDIHDLEDMINSIIEKSGREIETRLLGETLQRDKSPYRPRITLADALSDLVIALNETSVGPQTGQLGSYDHEYESNEDSFGDGERRDDEDRYSNRGSKYDYAGEDERGHVAAANDHELRAAAEWTFARAANRWPRSDGHFNNDRGFARDNR